MVKPRRRWLIGLGALLIAVAVIAAVPAIRTPALRGAGWASVAVWTDPDKYFSVHVLSLGDEAVDACAVKPARR